ncbi:protein-glutamine gamma-glutamyltransferase E-like [Pyxicephalus adspersus]|uniref:protein-glutamine gamma-glutamyltransferase E-like n=1 Tax=Pyxicephalus adspersus TaxID=30357 RepID=UPI003B591C9F
MSSLQVINYDFQKTKNATAHRTIDYDTNDLVVRRGQPVFWVLTFNRSVQPGDDLKIIAETGPSPSVQKNTRAEMALSSSSSGTSWSAVRGPSSNNTMNITINIPVNAPIGKYKLSLQATSGGRSNVSSLGGFIVLFNPWASADEVYMSNEAERVEYVLNETGLYWFGNVNNYGSRRWDYAQFERDILNISMAVLDRSPEYRRDPATDVSRRNDPIYVGRILSAMVNSNDNDNGIVVGNWSGNYSGGVSPTTWNGSAAILRQWIRSGPVKYGQCWVYAGVLCTVLRCLGIPARLIINFQSAHDTDENLMIDEYYDEFGKSINESADSIWNFHAWDEAYFTRKDLVSFYDGWQILDATPQEPSQGIFRLGPTSLKAVKEGDVDKPYDTPFVFSEVNADQAYWVKYRDGTRRLLYSEPAGVGQLTSTKAIGSFQRRDVTDDYKYREGSDKEREIFSKATNIMKPPRTMSRLAGRESIMSRLADDESGSGFGAAAPPPEPEFSASFKKVDETQVGEDLKLSLTFKNTVEKAQKIKVNITANAIIYNNTPVKDIQTESQTVTLGPKEEKSIQLTITYSKYRLAITPDNMIKVAAVCVDEQGGSLLVQTVVTLKNPALLIRAIENARLDKTSQVDCIFTNPIQEDVPESILIVEGSGLMSGQLVVNVPHLKRNQRVTIEFDISPSKKGDRSILADFSSKKFPNVKGFQTIPVSS